MREQEILAALGRGEKPYGIGLDLGISENSVLTHVARARRKLGARDWQGAVSRARRRKLI